MKRVYKLKEKMWLYPGKAGWHFITIPKTTALDIDDFFSHAKRGWGSLPVTVTVGKTSWKTSIFPDKKTETYLLPVKGEVRKAEGVHEGKEVSFSLDINL